jgi:hypothetical protein
VKNQLNIIIMCAERFVISSDSSRAVAMHSTHHTPSNYQTTANRMESISN